jgi:hypothetical protein
MVELGGVCVLNSAALESVVSAIVQWSKAWGVDKGVPTADAACEVENSRSKQKMGVGERCLSLIKTVEGHRSRLACLVLGHTL